MTKYHSLIESWHKCNLESPPYLFPNDERHIKGFSGVRIYRSFDEYVTSPEFGVSDINLHLGLLPVPFAGNLERASIFILMLNPGLSAGDYFAEQKVTEFRNAYIRGLRQENADDEFPFIFLNPNFAWHPGFSYWHKKFGALIEKLAHQSGITYQRAMSILSKNLACLELLPYHSKSFGSGSLLKVLPSVKVMQNFVHEVLIPKAKDGKVIIIATRSVKKWQLPKHKNIITYEGGETRSAHLSPSSRGGMAIANHLSLFKQKGG
ncbi:MAG: hypothetical protein B6D34_09235 [Candidatus Brocadia sp. UTAMX1]|jgi:hypothetical protein|nr:MAG: hypothetical protein B6D34_09235 [Candidatus Brocadia sp. UTAMX1]